MAKLDDTSKLWASQGLLFFILLDFFLSHPVSQASSGPITAVNLNS